MSTTNMREQKPREVAAVHGTAAAMGYKYRARIESKMRRHRKVYRYVIEEHHMAWSDHDRGSWREDREFVVAEANRWLDRISTRPRGEYI